MAHMHSSALDLNYWKQHLGHIPESVWDQVDAETLVLADNDLQQISPRIGLLRRLRMLDLGHNALSSLPDELGDLSGLSDFLYLHDNQLSLLPRSLSGLKRLRYLNISENRFEIFPEAVCGMTGLRELRVSDNRIRSLPESIAGLRNVREIHLRNNLLTLLPEAISQLPELRLLDLRNNPIESLPETILSMPKLEKLDLRWVSSLKPTPWLNELERKGCSVYQ
jgi:Leucine-rich repeat (LRR) protein